MSPDQRTELESLVAAHMPPISGSERERLLFDSARELGRQQGSRQAVRKSVAAAAVSCGLTLLLSWAVIPGVRSGHLPAADAVPDVRLADNPPAQPQTIAKAAARNSAERIAATRSAASPASSSSFDQHVLTPVSWSARWELSHIGEVNADRVALEPAAGKTSASSADTDHPASTPFRAGMPLDQL